MSKEFKDWVSSALSGTASTKSGAIVATDPSFREQARLNFQAVVGGVTWPGLDAASKDAISVTVTLAPQSSTFPARYRKHPRLCKHATTEADACINLPGRDPGR